MTDPTPETLTADDDLAIAVFDPCSRRFNDLLGMFGVPCDNPGCPCGTYAEPESEPGADAMTVTGGTVRPDRPDDGMAAVFVSLRP